MSKFKYKETQYYNNPSVTRKNFSFSNIK